MSENFIGLQVTRPQTQQGLRCIQICMEALNEFVEKNNGYGEPDGEDLGAKGQFADMHRKWKLLRKYYWDGQTWQHHEPVETVLKELIGHLLLTVWFERGGEGQ